jgi:hypothetical protein
MAFLELLVLKEKPDNFAFSAPTLLIAQRGFEVLQR